MLGFVRTRILRPRHAPGQSGGGSRLPPVPLRFTAARLAAQLCAFMQWRNDDDCKRPKIDYAEIGINNFRTLTTGCLVIELDGGGRILLSEPAHVTLLAQLLESVAGHREGGRP